MKTVQAKRRRARIRQLLTLTVLACAPCAADWAGATDARWSDALERALKARALAGAQISALVVARESGAELFARHAERAQTPASTQKLLTSVAALSAFGPAHRFETLLLADAAPDASGALETLYVRGGGDPALRSEEWWRLAADLRARGVREVRGDLVLDASAFDAQHWHPDWQLVSTRAYHAPVGALSANYGAFLVRVVPGARAGEAARVFVDPPLPYLRVTARVKTLARAPQQGLRIAQDAGEDFERVTVTGNVRAGAKPSEFWRSVHDPTRYAGAVLREQLEANGIAVRGGTRLARAPENARVLLRFEGPPLRRSALLLLKYSNNAMAESLLKSLAARANGGGGDWPRGARLLRRELESLGLPLAGLHIADGSGLSRANRVSARTLVAALRLADANFLFGPELLAALPLAAQDGTLEDRAERSRGRVRAKTGNLKGISALAGFARHASGAEFAFALLVDGTRGDDAAVMRAVDDFAAALVGAH